MQRSEPARLNNTACNCLVRFRSQPSPGESRRWRGGWYHTGDIGQLNYQTQANLQRRRGKPTLPTVLSVIDRVGSVEEALWNEDSVWIETSSLEERVYGVLPEVGSVVLMADRNQPGIIAAVVPSHELIASWERDSGATPGALALEQARFPRGSTSAMHAVPAAVEASLLSVLRTAGQSAQLPEYAVPLAVILDCTPWTEHEGLLTATGKVRRPAVKQVYNSWMNAKYAEVQSARPDALGEIPQGVGVVATDNESTQRLFRAVLASLEEQARLEKYSQTQIKNVNVSLICGEKVSDALFGLLPCSISCLQQRSFLPAGAIDIATQAGVKDCRRALLQRRSHHRGLLRLPHRMNRA